MLHEKKFFSLFFATAFIIAEGTLGNVGNLSNTISCLCQSKITFSVNVLLLFTPILSMIVKF